MKTSTFEPLNRLFRGNTDRVRQALEIFARVTRQDLAHLDAACASRDWTTVGMLAHKMKAGCLQIGEAAAAAGLAAIERTVSGGRVNDAIHREFATTREELEGVMMRVDAYLATKDEVGEE